MKKIRFDALLLTAIVLFAILGAFSKVMTTMNHNEHKYIAASLLVTQNRLIYKDFGFDETPYLPILYGYLFKLLNTGSYYLFMGKMISLLALLISGTCLFVVARRVVNDAAAALSMVALFLLNTSIVDPAGQVSNYIIPLMLSFASFYLFEISFDAKDIKPFGLTVAGLFLAIAVGIRLMYATVLIPFVAVILIYSTTSGPPSLTPTRRRIRCLAPFAVGVAAGLLPLLFFLADFQSFIFNNLGFHFLNGYWSQISGYSKTFSLLSKLDYAKGIFFQIPNLILITGILVAVGLSKRARLSDGRCFRFTRHTIEQIPKGAFLAFLLFVIAIPTTLAPTPSWSEYYAMPVSFLFLLLVYSCATKSPGISLLQNRLLSILVLICVISNGPLMVTSIYQLRDRHSWAGLLVHDVSINIRNALPNYRMANGEKIATLSPLYAVEANLPIYLELATGPFTYRSGDLLTRQQRQHFVVTSPRTIGQLFNADRPAAILAGFEGPLDKPLIKYALSHKYRKIHGFFGGGELYVLETQRSATKHYLQSFHIRVKEMVTVR